MKTLGNKPASAKASAGKKVFVGLSGGVDSSVSAALLKQAGYDVIGVFIRVWSPDWLPCEWKEERRDAMRVAAHLGIPFITLDLQEEYKKGVVDYMLDEYKKGRTPNPDVMCNREIKFGAFLTQAREMGADYIATGHYAQNINSILHEGTDKTKDQSYFLWTLTPEDLTSVLFPVGHLEKSEVRKLAQKFKLPTAQKKDSQGICFIGKVDMREFLSHYIETKTGKVLNEAGEVVGTHDGAVFYTIGQRHGFNLNSGHKSPEDAAYYIISKNIEQNTLTVSHKNQKTGELKNVQAITLSHINLPQNLEEKKYGARIRYRQEKQTCRVEKSAHEVKIIFDLPQGGVSVGQSLVLYDGEKCLGGGISEAIS